MMTMKYIAGVMSDTTYLKSDSIHRNAVFVHKRDKFIPKNR